MKTKNNQIYDLILRFKYFMRAYYMEIIFFPAYFNSRTCLCKRNALNQHTGLYVVT